MNNNNLKNTIMILLEIIDELRAQSVTPEQFKKMWGYSTDEYVDKMMKFVEEQRAAKAADASIEK